MAFDFCDDEVELLFCEVFDEALFGLFVCAFGEGFALDFFGCWLELFDPATVPVDFWVEEVASFLDLLVVFGLEILIRASVVFTCELLVLDNLVVYPPELMVVDYLLERL